MPIHIKVPKVPASAFNPKRKASDLLKSHVTHLQHVLARRPDTRRLVAQATHVKTEADAAAFIGKATALLHPEGTPPKPSRRGAASSRSTRRPK